MSEPTGPPLRQTGKGESKRGFALPAVLFVLTCATTYKAGGLAFAATLMGILVVHEAGHYVAARIHGVETSLPHFIPLPPQVSLGTLGAVIHMRRPIRDRNKLLDVGAAGPLAGLAVAVPLLVAGLFLSPLGLSGGPGLVVEGNSLAYLGIKYLVTGRLLPAADGTDVHLHPMAFAAWVGLLVTMINLLPIGQLDGGHVARAWWGARHERVSAWLHRALLLLAAAVLVWMARRAHAAGFTPVQALQYGGVTAVPWLGWALVLGILRRAGGGVYHPPVDDTPLTRSRKVVAAVVAVVFVAIFTPVPLRPALPPSSAAALSPI